MVVIPNGHTYHADTNKVNYYENSEAHNPDHENKNLLISVNENFH
jgi:hypothetical protein